ncbi:unnamed protein product [Rotaria sp. Silwood2]|nr:unnamed protein product [Rotaria sp. Silwood2]
MVFVHVASDTRSRNSCPIHSDRLEVEIETGDEWLAGTDDEIHLLLHSANGLVCQAYNLDNWGNDRERNSIDRYTICCPKGFLDGDEEISMFALAYILPPKRTDLLQLDNWFIERVTIKGNGRDIFNYRFHSWISPLKERMFGVSKVNETSYVRF